MLEDENGNSQTPHSRFSLRSFLFTRFVVGAPVFVISFFALIFVTRLMEVNPSQSVGIYLSLTVIPLVTVVLGLLIHKSMDVVFGIPVPRIMLPILLIGFLMTLVSFASAAMIISLVEPYMRHEPDLLDVSLRILPPLLLAFLISGILSHGVSIGIFSGFVHKSALYNQIAEYNRLGSFLVTHGVVGWPTYALSQYSWIMLFSFSMNGLPFVILIVVLGSIASGVISHVGSDMVWGMPRKRNMKIIVFTGFLTLLSTWLLIGDIAFLSYILRLPYIVYLLSYAVLILLPGFFSHRIYDLVYRRYSPTLTVQR